MTHYMQKHLSAELEEKHARVTRWLKEGGYDGISFTKARNFAWMTGGVASNQIALSNEVGSASALLLADGRKFVVAAHSEVPRLMADGLEALGYQPVELKWYEPKDFRGLLGLKGRIASDVAQPGCDLVDIAPLRWQLTPPEINKYRWLGRQCGEAVTATVREITRGVTERGIEAQVSNELMQRTIRPTVLLIGSDTRIVRFRHALPSDHMVDKYAMINICAEKWGLVISLTRLVHFGPLSEELRKRLRAAATVNARFMAGLRPGTKMADLFDQMQHWYAELGFPNEWQLHHQGGATGYAERDYLLRPGASEIVLEHQAFAMNPTVQGAKCEDTVIASVEGTENITETDDWPTIPIEVEGEVYRSPDVLIQDGPQTEW